MLIGDVVIEPENSLLFQSRDAAYHPGVIDKCHKRNILVNGDGFGIAWYGETVSKGSCCFKIVTPAWSDVNLRNIGKHVSSSTIFAHVRAAASGHNPHEHMIVSNENCHPFTYKQYTFMHNGGISDFHEIKLAILNLLSRDSFQNIKGSTDSEHIFALYLDCLPPECKRTPENSLQDMVIAMNKTISIVQYLCAEAGICTQCSLNLCITDGIHIVATRFRSGSRNPPSLYYNFGSNFVCSDGQFYPTGDPQAAAEIIISSAPLCKVIPVDACDPNEESNDIRSDGDDATHHSTRKESSSAAFEVEPRQYDGDEEEEDNEHRHGGTTRTRPSNINTTTTYIPTSTSSERLADEAYGGKLRHSTMGTTTGTTTKAPTPTTTITNNTVKKAAASAVSSDDGEDSRSSTMNMNEGDIGAWILVPKNHMLIIRGDRSNPHRVESAYLEEIEVTALVGVSKPLSHPLKRKSFSGSQSPSGKFEGQHRHRHQEHLGTSTAATADTLDICIDSCHLDHNSQPPLLPLGSDGSSNSSGCSKRHRPSLMRFRALSDLEG